MRPRIEIRAACIVNALEQSKGNIEAAAAIVSAEIGRNVSSRTLRRRMADYSITPKVRYEVEEAAA